MQGPHRLVVRTSRRGRDNPGATPGVDTLLPLPPNAFKPLYFHDVALSTTIAGGYLLASVGSLQSGRNHDYCATSSGQHPLWHNSSMSLS